MKTPHWILDEDWAIGTDAYSWVLFHRTRNKEGDPTGWKPKGYYPSANQLLESMARKISRLPDDECDLSLLAHIEATYERVTALSDAFSEKLKADIWVGLKRPQGKAA